MYCHGKSSEKTLHNSRHDLIPVRRWEHGAVHHTQDQVATECAVALVYNDISHVVTMATPENLEDLAVGFSLTEGVVLGSDEIYDIEIQPHALGTEIKVSIAAARFSELKQRRRNLTGRTGCGLCGAESLQQAIRPTVKVEPIAPIADTVIQNAQQLFARQQPLQALTGAAHGAAWCDRNGEIILLREDVGRHNALDKLIGAMLRSQLTADDGFVFVSSRISYEMVQKAGVAGVAVLAAVSAPTQLAIQMADAGGITLVAFVRQGRHAVYSHPRQIHSRAVNQSDP